MNYEVVTAVQNQLALVCVGYLRAGVVDAVFASREEAEQAIEACKSIFGNYGFKIVETVKQVSMTFEA